MNDKEYTADALKVLLDEVNDGFGHINHIYVLASIDKDFLDPKLVSDAQRVCDEVERFRRDLYEWEAKARKALYE